MNKSERFKRLASQRTNNVLKKLQILGNCANRSAYEFSEEDINKIFSVLEKAVKETKSKFNITEKREFKL